MSTIPSDHPAITTVLPHEHYWQAGQTVYETAYNPMHLSTRQPMVQILVCRCGTVRAVESTRWEWLRGEEQEERP